MRSPVRSLVCMLVALTFAAPVVRAQSTSPADSVVAYELVGANSDFEWGCFPPCMCPALIRAPLTGRFQLVAHAPSPGPYATYDVRDVVWSAPGTSGSVAITGSGTYRHGGEVGVFEQLVLDLSFDGGPPLHFDSGLVPPGAAFPAIRTRISLHGEFCHDSVLALDARPAYTTTVGGGSHGPTLGVAPNPFVEFADVRCTLPVAGVVTLRVFDVSGRRVRTLLAGQWLDAGPHAIAWDGTRDDGRAAPAGMYLVRLDTPAGSRTQTLVRRR